MTPIAHRTATLLAGLLVLAAGVACAQTGAEPTTAVCGGIAGLHCPSGSVCVMTGAPHPDASGQCRATGGERVCPQSFRPVCGGDGRTYSNPCVARLHGATVAHDGQCKAATPPPTAE